MIDVPARRQLTFASELDEGGSAEIMTIQANSNELDEGKYVTEAVPKCV